MSCMSILFLFLFQVLNLLFGHFKLKNFSSIEETLWFVKSFPLRSAIRILHIMCTIWWKSMKSKILIQLAAGILQYTKCNYFMYSNLLHTIQQNIGDLNLYKTWVTCNNLLAAAWGAQPHTSYTHTHTSYMYVYTHTHTLQFLWSWWHGSVLVGETKLKWSESRGLSHECGITPCWSVWTFIGKPPLPHIYLLCRERMDRQTAF